MSDTEGDKSRGRKIRQTPLPKGDPMFAAALAGKKSYPERADVPVRPAIARHAVDESIAEGQAPIPDPAPTRQPPQPEKTTRKPAERSASASWSLPAWLEENRLPLILSAIWIVCLCGYAVGYFSFYGAEGNAAPPPTMNLLFFAFALAGPLAMVWGGATIANRAGGLSAKLTEQSDAARHLATELSGLKGAVDHQRQIIEANLTTSLNAIEKQVEAAATEMAATVAVLTDDASVVLTERNAKLEQAFARTEKTIAATIAERFTDVNTKLTATAARIDQHLADQIHTLNTMMDSRVTALDDTIAAGQQRLGALMEKRALGADGYLQTATEHMETMLSSTSTRLTEDLDNRAARIDEALEAALEKVQGQITGSSGQFDTALAENRDRMHEALDKTEGRVTESTGRFEKALTDNHERMEQSLAKLEGRIADNTERFEKVLTENRDQMEAALTRRGDTLERQNAMIETAIPAQLTALKVHLDTMQASLAANPPASDEELSRRLGTAATDALSNERETLADIAGRVTALQSEAREMLSRIDRTARMNAALDRTPMAGQRPAEALPQLPFADLPIDDEAAPPDWSSVLGTLDLPEASTDVGRALKRAALADRGVAEVVDLAGKVQDALAEEGLFLTDLAPEHASADTWRAYLDGQRSDRLTGEMTAIKDEIALTVARARLRNDPAFHALALRFVDRFQKLMLRVADDQGAESRLLEFAETLSGRAFLLLGQLTRAFNAVEE